MGENLPAPITWKPATERELAIELTKLFLGFPSHRGDGERHKGTIAVYVEALEGLPLMAVQMGRGKVLQDGGAFPPSAGDFRAVCQRFVPRKEPTMFGLPQPGPEPEAEPDPRIGAMMRQLVNDLAAKCEGPEARRLGRETDHDRAEAKKDALERLADLQADRDRPLTVSPYLAAQLRGEKPIGEGRLGAQPVSEFDVHLAATLTRQGDR